MIVNRRNGDSLALEFSKLLNKSLKKKASQESAGQLLLDETSADDKFKDENFLMDEASASSSDAEVLSNSLDDSASMVSDFSSTEDKMKSSYEDKIGGLVDFGEDVEPESIVEARQIMSGLGKIAKSLKDKGESFAADMVVATAHEINDNLIKEAAKTQFVKAELMKIASELDRDGDKFSRDMVLATIKNL